MPLDSALGGSQTIAVVGTGIAGLSAAWLLAKRHQVTVFERDRRIGGHCHTMKVGPLAVDTGSWSITSTIIRISRPSSACWVCRRAPAPCRFRYPSTMAAWNMPAAVQQLGTTRQLL